MASGREETPLGLRLSGPTWHVMNSDLDSLVQARPFRQLPVNSDAGFLVDRLLNQRRIEEEEWSRLPEKIRAFLTRLEQLGVLTWSPGDPQELIRIATGMRRPLRRLFIEITTRCNLRCGYCYLRQHDDTNHVLPADVISRVVNEAKSLGLWQVDLTGGEVFLHPEIMQILRQLDNERVMTTVFTNGTMIDQEKADLLASMRGLRSVVTSIDGVNEAHDQSRGRLGSFEETMAALQSLQERDIPVRVNVSVWKGNESKVNEVTDLLKSLRVRFLVAPVIELVPEAALLGLQGRTAGIALRSMMDRELPVSVPRGSSSVIPFCGVARTFLFISATGSISFCPTLSEREDRQFHLGDASVDSLAEIWQSSRMDRFSQEQCPELAECPAAGVCRGGCRSRAYLAAKRTGARDEVACGFWRESEMTSPGGQHGLDQASGQGQG